VVEMLVEPLRVSTVPLTFVQAYVYEPLPPEAETDIAPVVATPLPVMLAEAEPALKEAVRAERFMATDTDTLVVAFVLPIASVTVQIHTAVLVVGAVPDAVQVADDELLPLMLMVASPLERVHK